VSITPSPERRDADIALRDQLSSLQGLLVLSMVMTDSTDERHIVHLAATTVGSLGDVRMCGIHLLDGGWQDATGPCERTEIRADIEAQFVVLNSTGGLLAIQGEGWGWAYPLRSPQGHFGSLIVSADAEPESHAQFLLRVLAQQTGIALANARLHGRERSTAEELLATNAALAETVSALERSTAIHDRLTRVALAGEGQQGIAQAVHELTDHAIAVEDRYGNLLAWAGPHQPCSYPKQSSADRSALLDRARAEGQLIADDGRLYAIATAGVDVLGVLVLIDTEGTAASHERVALEHGATVLAMELARLRSLAESELRVGGDLVEQLLAGALDETAAHARARALGYDLERPHRVVAVGSANATADHDAFFDAVRRAARDAGVGTLLAAGTGTVVVLSDADQDWNKFRQAIDGEAAAGACRIGVGGLCSRPVEYPRSFEEARLALRVQEAVGSDATATAYDELGVYQMLADVAHADGVERFALRWLGPLLEYDDRRNAELVESLSLYLEYGRSLDAAAKALSVHRSTLKYRLQRIGEISGHDLSDPDTSFNLQLAIRAWHTLTAMRAANHH
jgi:DNA-binding PucR family transcriptional regulator